MDELFKDMRDKGLVEAKISDNFSSVFGNLEAGNNLNRQLSLEILQTVNIGKVELKATEKNEPAGNFTDKCEVDFSDKLIDLRN